MVMAGEGGLDVAGAGVPQAGDHVVARGQQPAAVEARRHRAHPVRVPAQRLDAIARGDVPDAEGFVAGGGDEQVAGGGGAGGAGGDEAHGGDGVVVAGEGAGVLVGLGGVPEFDGEVGGAGGEEGGAARAAEVEVQHRFGMAFDGAFEVAVLVVPDFDGGVFGGGGEGGEDRVEGEGGDGEAVRLESMARGGAGEPCGGVEGAVGEGGGGCGVEFGLEGGVAAFEVHYLEGGFGY